MAVYTSGGTTGFNLSALWIENTLVATGERFEGLISQDIELLSRTERYSKFVFERGDLTYEYEGSWTVSASSGVLTTQVAASGVYNAITVRSGNTVVARVSGLSFNVDFGTRTSLTLLDLLSPVVSPVVALLLGGTLTAFANLHTGATPDIAELAFAGNDTLQGGSGNDVLYGHDGNDIINGAAGADVMNGGQGDDVYYIDDLNDVVSDSSGNDRVYILIDGYGLSKLAGIETTIRQASGNDTVIGGSPGNDTIAGGPGGDTLSGGSGDDQIVGGDGNDSLGGGDGNDVIEGGPGNDTLVGGPGADTMSGGAGDDTYYVDNPGDQVFEGLNQGIDRVYSSISYALTDNIEFLFLQSGRTGTGNNLANVIYGNSSQNTLSGRSGNDEIYGRAGNDKISGSTGSDHLFGESGRDSINGGSGNDRLSGGTGNDTLIGSSGNDKLNGGYGNDSLYGGSGRDTFIFKDKLSTSGNLDRIRDFNSKYDSIQLENGVFTKIGRGSETRPLKINKAYFTIGEAAKDENDYIIYDDRTGSLLYDRDGSGSAQAREFAKLSANLNLTHNDFYVI